MPEKTQYQKGEELDTSGLKLTVVFENGESRTVALKNCVIKGFNPEKEGQQTVTVQYTAQGKTVETSYDVIVRNFAEKKLLYFTDCGDHDPATVSAGDSLGMYNSVTDRIYGVDEKAGKSWGVVTSDDDADITETRPVKGSKAAYTKYQRANNYDINDGQDKAKTFRYADGQDLAGIDPRYVRYRYELEPGEYQVSVCMGNAWNNSANPDVYAGAAGVEEKDTKLNDRALRIEEGGNKIVSKEVVLPEGSTSMDVYALSADATINMNYIVIEKIDRKEVPRLASIELVPPVKTEYQTGEALDLTGMKVKAVYEDGAKRDLKTEECEVTGFDPAKPGSQTVTVTYTEDKGTGYERSAKKTFAVTVKGQKPQEPSVDKEPLAAAVAEAEKLQPSGYTAESFQTFQKALQEAKKILANANATEDEVKAALDLLRRARSQLKTQAPPAETVKVKKITISGKGFQIAAGKKVQLSATVAPKHASNQRLSWTIADKYKKYASVNSKGVVTTKKKGAGKTVTVTAAAKDGSGCRATVKIKIMKHAVTKIRLKANKTLRVGKKLKIKAAIQTNGKNVNKKLSWETSNKKYATVDSKGTVKAKKAGRGKKVTVTARSTDGTNKKASIKINIKK